MATILAVDDSRPLREMVFLTLNSAEHDVVMAVDGVDALEKAKLIEADLVITDIHMPRMDGIQLLLELRALANYRFTPMLVLTTDSREDIKNQGKAAGATGWLVKPFDPNKLLAVVNRILG